MFIRFLAGGPSSAEQSLRPAQVETTQRCSFNPVDFGSGVCVD